MKKFKRNHKGFTLTELAIVIAVIAILVAVLVPTFISLINKANETSDEQLVKNLNTALSVEGADMDIDTPSAALDALEEYGYAADKLVTKSDGKIVYDQVTATFALVSDGAISYGDEDIDPDASTTWYFASSQSDITSDTASYIITGTWNSDVVYKGNGGIDTSHASIRAGVTAGKDTSTQTASTSLKVTTKTYSTTSTKSNDEYPVILNLMGVDVFLYFHNSSVKFILYTEENLSYNIISDTSLDESVCTIIGEGIKDETISLNDSGAVTIANQVVSEAYSSSTDSAEEASLQLGTEKYPYLIANETQFANITSGSYKNYTYNYKYYKLVDDITLTSATAQYGSNWYSYYHTSSSSLSYIVFDGDNHIITLANDVKDLVANSYNSNSAFYQFTYGCTVKNTTFNFTASGQQILKYNYRYSTATKANYFENVTTTGDLTVSGNMSSFVTYTGGYIYFTNCTNKANMTGTGTSTDYNAAFVAYVYGTLHATFTDCTNEGNIICGKAAMFVGNNCGTLYLTVNNSNNDGIIRATYTDTGYTPYYYISTGDSSAKQITIDGTDYSYNEAPALENTFHGPTDVMTISLNADGYYEITMSNQSNIATYEISVGLYVDIINGTSRYYITITIDASEVEDGTYVSAFQKLQFMDLATYLSKSGKTEFDSTSSDVTAIGNGYMVYVEGAYYYLINNSDYSLSSGIANIGMVTSSVYSSNGKLLSSSSAN